MVLIARTSWYNIACCVLMTCRGVCCVSLVPTTDKDCAGLYVCPTMSVCMVLRLIWSRFAYGAVSAMRWNPRLIGAKTSTRRLTPESLLDPSAEYFSELECLKIDVTSESRDPKDFQIIVGLQHINDEDGLVYVTILLLLLLLYFIIIVIIIIFPGFRAQHCNYAILRYPPWYPLIFWLLLAATPATSLLLSVATRVAPYSALLVHHQLAWLNRSLSATYYSNHSLIPKICYFANLRFFLLIFQTVTISPTQLL